MNLMTISLRKLVLTFTLLLSFTLYSFGIVPDTTALRVGVAGNEPFVIHNENEQDGVSIEVWEAIALEAGWKFHTIAYHSVSEAIEALEKGDLDVVVGPTSITSARAERLRFSQPYYQASLSILSKSDSLSTWERIKPFFSIKLLFAVCIFLFILAIVGTLLWLAERKASPEQFPPDISRGIANGMWCAIVTMSTTGYGDIAPITFLGRVIAGMWMVISIIFATTMVAGIASTLTLTGLGTNEISTIEQIRNKNVAVLNGSPAVDLLETFHANAVYIETLDEGYQLLMDKKVNGVVFDRPQLLYFLKNNPDPSVTISEAEYMRQGYGFAFPLNSTLVHTVNIKLLHLSEDGEMNRVVNQWVGEKR